VKVSFFLSLIAVTFASAEISEGSSPLPVALKTFQIYHALKPNIFTPRGTIEISFDGNGSLVSTFQMDESNSLDDEVLKGLDAIVSNNGFYRIKVEDKDSGAAVIASVPACDVRRANLREQIGLTLGNTGSIISLSYKPLVSPLAAQCHELNSFMETKQDKEYKFRTTVNYSTATPGMAIPSVLPNSNPPMGYDWIKRSKKSVGDSAENVGEGESSSSDTGFDPGQDTPEQPSFLRRYWYIILPITLMTFMGTEEPAKEQQQGGAQGSGAGVAGASAAAGAAVAGTSNRQRRGKRG
jgi:hypothetical protein